MGKITVPTSKGCFEDQIKIAHSTILAIGALNKCQLLAVFVVAIVNFTVKSITRNMNSVHIRLLKSVF